MYVKFKSTLTGVLTLYVYFIGESKSYLIYIYMLMGEPTPVPYLLYTCATSVATPYYFFSFFFLLFTRGEGDVV